MLNYICCFTIFWIFTKNWIRLNLRKMWAKFKHIKMFVAEPINMFKHLQIAVIVQFHHLTFIKPSFFKLYFTEKELLCRSGRIIPIFILFCILFGVQFMYKIISTYSWHLFRKAIKEADVWRVQVYMFVCDQCTLKIGFSTSFLLLIKSI